MASIIAEFSACCAGLGDEIELLELSQPFDQGADLLAENMSISSRVEAVFSIVSCSTAATYGRVVELEIGEDRRRLSSDAKNRDRGRALCAPCAFHRIDIGRRLSKSSSAFGLYLDRTRSDKFILSHHFKADLAGAGPDGLDGHSIARLREAHASRAKPER